MTGAVKMARTYDEVSIAGGASYIDYLKETGFCLPEMVGRRCPELA
ncbi:hypothetical protein FIU97_10350 [Roseivivax sp. THAF40]|nr:hypothetical protein [Roseivivax sp. THAF40]QFS83227.1 hypothetical protein FIV09_10365 [Roseivivax sp. THAF197b]QFT46971.1 hypothetical protein FIU97_10350 [Roseivivax sp. THAF40]